MGEIVSGKCILKLKTEFYDKSNVNNIILGLNDKIKMKNSFFPGTLITIKVPYILNKEINDRKFDNLSDFFLK